MDVNEHERELWKWEYRKKEFCINCGAPIPKYKRSFCSNDCYTEFNYIALREDIRLGHRDWRLVWWEVREEALERDNYTCQVCGFHAKTWREAEKLHVHHIVPVHKGGKCLDLKNLITLCHKCHKQTFKNGYAGIPLRQLSLKDFMVIRHEMTGASDRPRAVTEVK